MPRAPKPTATSPAAELAAAIHKTVLDVIAKDLRLLFCYPHNVNAGDSF